MTQEGSTDAKLAPLKKAGRMLRAARAAGEQDHADMLYEQVQSAAKTIFNGPRKNLVQDDARDALCELIASAILMSNLSAAPKLGWVGRLIQEFREKSPLTQIGLTVGTVTFLGAVSAGIWVATPPLLRSLADLMDGGRLGSVAGGAPSDQEQKQEAAVDSSPS